jgi:hypothetical protein
MNSTLPLYMVYQSLLLSASAFCPVDKTGGDVP